MKITKVEIDGVGGIRHLSIEPNESMNIICGPNGIGKTTLLECIAHLFSAGDTNLLKRNFFEPRGVVKASLFQAPEAIDVVSINLNSFEPNKADNIGGAHQLSPYILSLKTTRTFNYQPLQSVSRDTEKNLGVTYSEARTGIPLTDVKNWFVNRYLYSAHPQALNTSQLENFELAKTCFSKLNPDYKFIRVAAATNEIMISTPSGDLYYEYLSSGFKSCLPILFGIIKEVEFRFTDTAASDFRGIILIDELELHLHPDWQSKIISVLSEIFHQAQFFVTTHSPHIIQSAKPETIIALGLSDNDVYKRQLPVSDYGFSGWTIEEVLEDVMGMEDTRTSMFRGTIDEFSRAINNEDIKRAKELYETLNLLLHPLSSTRKLLSFQLSALSGGKND